MTELGIYILGAAALCILAAAGIHAGNGTVVFWAVLASGAAYISQSAADIHNRDETRQWALALNAIALLVSIGSWLMGVLFLL